MPQFNAPANTTHMAIVATLGNFVMIWAILDQVLDATIMKQLKIDPERAVIVSSGLGFERKLSIVRSLLHLRDPQFAPAIRLLNELVALARRNVLLHGQPHVEAESIEFVKTDTDQILKARSTTLRRKEFSTLVSTMGEKIAEVQQLLDVSESDLDAMAKIGKSLTSKSATSPKPPSRKAP